MESTAQYRKPVWGTLERYWKPIGQTREGALATSGTLHLAQALLNCGRRGRKKDFRDAERLVKRLVTHELSLSFVPDVEQRLWADSRAHQVLADVQASAIAKSIGSSAGRSTHQAIQLGLRSAGSQRTTHARGQGPPPRCEAAISATRASKNTKQEKNLKSELRGETPPRISSVERCAQLLSDLEHRSLSERRLETTSKLSLRLSAIRVLREGTTSVVP